MDLHQHQWREICKIVFLAEHLGLWSEETARFPLDVSDRGRNIGNIVPLTVRENRMFNSFKSQLRNWFKPSQHQNPLYQKWLGFSFLINLLCNSN